MIKSWSRTYSNCITCQTKSQSLALRSCLAKLEKTVTAILSLLFTSNVLTL